MASLADILLQSQRDQVVDACVQLVDSEVASKKGLAGMTVKGAYTIVKKLQPGIIRDAVDKLLDEFVAELEPFYEAFTGSGEGYLEGYLSGRSTDVANALLNVTDSKAQKAKNRTIKKAYDKLRPTGQKHVEQAVPGIGRTIARFV